jgi:hypothetical protein
METFKDFLTELEQNISFDPEEESPEEFAKRAKLAHRQAGHSPSRAIKLRQQNIKDKTAQLKANPNDPLAKDRLAVKKMEERLVRMKIMLARKEDIARAKL